MRLLLAIAPLLVVSNASAEPPETAEERFCFDTSEPITKIDEEWATPTKSGRFELRYPDGKLCAKGRFRKGRPVGTWVQHFSSGKLRLRVAFGRYGPKAITEWWTPKQKKRVWTYWKPKFRAYSLPRRWRGWRADGSVAYRGKSNANNHYERTATTKYFDEAGELFLEVRRPFKTKREIHYKNGVVTCDTGSTLGGLVAAGKRCPAVTVEPIVR